MLKAEWKKTWARPMIRIAFLMICLVPALSVRMQYSAWTRDYYHALNAYAGPMDENWKSAILSAYDTAFETDNAPEDLSKELQALAAAREYAFMDQTLEDHIARLTEAYGAGAQSAHAALLKKAQSGKLVFGRSALGENMTNQYLVGWCALIFMILIGVDQFSGERDAFMTEMQAVTLQGRKALYRAKLGVMMLSALTGYLATNLCFFMALMIHYGPGRLDGLVQNFITNACPWPMSIGQYLLAVLGMGLAACLLTAMVIFLLASHGKSTQQSFALMAGATALPYWLAFTANLPYLALWLPDLMNGQWLFASYLPVKIGGITLEMWMLALMVMLLSGAICAGLIRRRRAYFA